MKKERIGFAFCGSFCTHKKVLEQYLLLTQEYETVIPIVSESAASTDTRFGSAADFLKTVETAAGRSAIRCIRDAEPIGPKKLLDALVIPLHRQHAGKAFRRRDRFHRYPGSQSASAQRPSRTSGYRKQRRPGR